MTELPLRGVLVRALKCLPAAHVADRLLDDGDDNELVEYADAIDRGDVDGDDDDDDRGAGDDKAFRNLRLWIDRVVAALDEDGDLDAAPPSSAKVFVGTIHQSKGREYDYVLVCRLNNDVLPHESALKAPGTEALEEERRVAYVAFSRAKTEMVVTYAEREGSQTLTPSMFLSDIPRHCKDARHVDDAADCRKPEALSSRGNGPREPPRKAPRCDS